MTCHPYLSVSCITLPSNKQIIPFPYVTQRWRIPVLDKQTGFTCEIVDRMHDHRGSHGAVAPQRLQYRMYKDSTLSTSSVIDDTTSNI